MITPNPLTRNQKLAGEVVVQLGNIAEALQHIAGVGGDSASRVESLQQEVLELTESKQRLEAEYIDRINDLERKHSEDKQVLSDALVALQNKVIEYERPKDITPDNIVEVMKNLNIDYQQ